MYNRYKDADFTKGKGFGIFGVSLDSKKAAWENIIKKANINWTQVSDLKFWASPIAKTFNIQALLFNVLVEGKGIIIAKDLHDNDLEYFIINLMPVKKNNNSKNYLPSFVHSNLYFIIIDSYQIS
jgi:hypothetical protein